MKQIPLNSVPNQSVSFNAGDSFWKLRVFQAAEFMLVDISRDGVTILNGVRSFSGVPLIKFEHLYSGAGNFVFDADVDWTDFSTGCNLYWLDPDEFAEYMSLRNGQ